jgi:hypothetical protein
MFIATAKLFGKKQRRVKLIGKIMYRRRYNGRGANDAKNDRDFDYGSEK